MDLVVIGLIVFFFIFTLIKKGNTSGTFYLFSQFMAIICAVYLLIDFFLSDYNTAYNIITLIFAVLVLGFVVRDLYDKYFKK
jgi:hypothetical protein